MRGGNEVVVAQVKKTNKAMKMECVFLRKKLKFTHCIDFICIFALWK